MEQKISMREGGSMCFGISRGQNDLVAHSDLLQNYSTESNCYIWS